MFGRRMDKLFSDSPNKKAWKGLLLALRKKHDQFSSSLGKSLNEDEIIEILNYMMIAIARNGFTTQERKIKLFNSCEKFGVHVLLTHFYSPVPNTTELTSQDFKPYEFHGLDFQVEKQWHLLRSWETYFQELQDVPLDKTDRIGEYYYNNPAFSGMDASIYYAMIRHFKPRKVIEVGAGHSTMIAAKACLQNVNTELSIIDPFLLDPIEKGFNGLSQVINKKVQDVDFSVFEELQENDILFIDNSHVSKIGSDVNHVILRILPRIQKGVIVHIHDIFLPFEYQKELIDMQVFWNEQYLLHAFLINNKDFEILMSNNYLTELNREEIKKLIPYDPHHYGGSFWIRKIN